MRPREAHSMELHRHSCCAQLLRVMLVDSPAIDNGAHDTLQIPRELPRQVANSACMWCMCSDMQSHSIRQHKSSKDQDSNLGAELQHSQEWHWWAGCAWGVNQRQTVRS